MPIDKKLSILLLLLCRCDLNAQEEVDVQKSLMEILRHHSRESIVALAHHHGVLPLVYFGVDTLVHTSRQDLPDSLWALHGYLRDMYRASAQRAMRMTAELIVLLDHLSSQDIDAIPFKGPVLAQLAYGDVTQREFDDLDILIEPQSIGSSRAIIESLGYVPAYPMTDIQARQWYRHAKDFCMMHTGKKIAVELHWRILDDDYPVGCPSGLLTQSPLQCVTIDHRTLQTFAPEPLLFYLCVHGATHLYERLIWLKDIDQVIRTFAIDWKTLEDLARQSRAQRMVFLSLHLVQSLLKTPVAPEFGLQADSHPWLQKSVDYILDDWGQKRSMPYRTLAMLRLFPTWSMKGQYLHKVLLKPSRSEYSTIALPAYLYWVYYLLRPLLLLRKYLGLTPKS
jgi:hypothetical protein